VFAYEKYVYPLYITDTRDASEHVDLLLIVRGKRRHYCWIKNLDCMLALPSSHRRLYHCRYCLHSFWRRELLTAHLPYCMPHGC
jgi:hypothetical protein